MQNPIIKNKIFYKPLVFARLSPIFGKNDKTSPIFLGKCG